ncbi:glycosyltransferase [Nocardia transvalensis]|uniref:glycosyltransferase n=1 Tax=Nocardia transvalensis TaxID=37333 RepID=UPI001894045D|nr:glycosyltransferase [Nocardia transvalensis]MBF6327532.1 glycosyltransferase family 1 protein [Nocardia transvalensis]
MRVLLATIGTRGDVQPVLALAVRLREYGAPVRICAPPDFGDLISGFQLPFVPLGPHLRPTAERYMGEIPPDEPDRHRSTTIADQFTTLTVAAADCDVLVACGALPVAARSVAEHRGIRYVAAVNCPIALPSCHHAPPPIPGPAAAPGIDNRALWFQETLRWNNIWDDALNAHRAAVGLDPVADVRPHVFTDRPLLAADPVLAPWPDPADPDVVQTGAWILPDRRPLPAELDAFLDAGEPPIYFGFGSTSVPVATSRVLIAAARALGRRAIFASGWADFDPVATAPDHIFIGEVNQQALFPRTAAVVHHGGAGTTFASARARTPQVVVSETGDERLQVYDQSYWARRVDDLGIGLMHPVAEPTVQSLTAALDAALKPAMAARARAVAATMRTDGAAIAAEYLIS